MHLAINKSCWKCIYSITLLHEFHHFIHMVRHYYIHCFTFTSLWHKPSSNICIHIYYMHYNYTHVFGHWYRESLICSLFLSLISLSLHLSFCDKHSCRICNLSACWHKWWKREREREIVTFNAIECTLNATGKNRHGFQCHRVETE